MKYLIIGSGPAAIFAAEAIRTCDKETSITIVSQEDSLAHSPVMLTYWMSGKHSRDEVMFRDPSWAKNNHIDTILNFRVRSLDITAKKITADDGRDVAYDRLLIATGTSPILIPIPGADASGVASLRYMHDSEAILGTEILPREVVIIGGGFVGLKLAYHLMERGIHVSIFEKEPKLAARVLDQRASKLIAQKLRDHGISVEVGVEVSEILTRNGCVSGVRLDNGNTKSCQRVVQAVGVRPNTQFIDEKDMELYRRGIVINEYLETTAPGVYAAGDVAISTDSITGDLINNATWPAAALQGRLAGLNMTGEKRIYRQNFPTNALNLFGMRIISAGQTYYEEDPGTDIFIKDEPGSYRKILVREGRIIGFIFIGHVADAGFVTSLMKKKADVGHNIEELLSARVSCQDSVPPNFGYLHGALFNS